MLCHLLIGALKLVVIIGLEGCAVLYTFPSDALVWSGLVRSERGGSLFVHALTSPN